MKWAVRNLVKFSKGTCEVLQLGWSNNLLDTDWILLGYGANLKNLQVLVYNSMNMNQQCTLDVMKANSILDCVSKSVASRLREVLILCCSGLIKLLWNTVSCVHEKFW